jgi:hypothetical protein
MKRRMRGINYNKSRLQEKSLTQKSFLLLSKILPF